MRITLPKYSRFLLLEKTPLGQGSWLSCPSYTPLDTLKPFKCLWNKRVQVGVSLKQLVSTQMNTTCKSMSCQAFGICSTRGLLLQDWLLLPCFSGYSSKSSCARGPWQCWWTKGSVLLSLPQGPKLNLVNCISRAVPENENSIPTVCYSSTTLLM